MAISEVSLRDVVLMAVEEINAKGGVMGARSQPVVVDPASNWDLFAEKAKQLLLQDKVAVVFGCWTSVSRKSVLPVFENNNGLLFYPVQYEGEECSKNVFYTGATPNQQLVPGAEYLMSKEGGSYKKFYLLGTDYVFPRTANKILRAFLLAKGVPAANIEEEYTPFSHQDYQTIVGKIKRFSSGGGACVLSTINGDSNVPFYKEFANQGLRSENAPIMAYSVAEDELRGMDTSALVGHLAAWNYFQSVETRRTTRSSSRRSRTTAKKTNLPGGDKRVTDDPMEAAYFGVYIWKQAVEKAKSFDVDPVRKAVYGQTFMAPGGHDQDARVQPAHLPAGADRRDPEGRPVQDHQPGAAHGRTVRSSRSRGASTRARTRAVTGSIIRARIRRRRDLASHRSPFAGRVARRGRGGPRAAAPAASPGRCGADRSHGSTTRTSAEAAVAVIGQTRDPKWIQFLAALRDGSVYARTRAAKTPSSWSAAAKATKGDQDVIDDQRRLRARAAGHGAADRASKKCRPTAASGWPSSRSSTPTRRRCSSPTPIRPCARGAAVKLGNQAVATAAPVVEEALKKEIRSLGAPCARGGVGADSPGQRRRRRSAPRRRAAWATSIRKARCPRSSGSRRTAARRRPSARPPCTPFEASSAGAC